MQVICHEVMIKSVLPNNFKINQIVLISSTDDIRGVVPELAIPTLFRDNLFLFVTFDSFPEEPDEE